MDCVDGNILNYVSNVHAYSIPNQKVYKMLEKFIKTCILVLVSLLPSSGFSRELDIYRYFQTNTSPLPIIDSVRISDSEKKYICSNGDPEYFVEQLGKYRIYRLTYYTISEKFVEEIISDFILVDSVAEYNGYFKDYYLGEHLLLVVKRSSRNKQIELQFSLKR